MFINIANKTINVEEILYAEPYETIEDISPNIREHSYRIRVVFKGGKERLTIAFTELSERDNCFNYVCSYLAAISGEKIIRVDN